MLVCNAPVWWTGDTHFGHDNIIRHCDRPFKNAREMDRVIIDNWKARVQPKDIVIHAGDVGWRNPAELKRVLDELPGEIHLVIGNHESAALNPKCRGRFASISQILEVAVPDKDAPDGERFIVCCHYGMRVWNKSFHGSWHLYGHSHGTLPPTDESLDVGVDCWDFAPVSYQTIKEKLGGSRGTPHRNPLG